MVDVLFLTLLDSLPCLDQLGRKRVAKIIPDIERLEAEPLEYFDSEDVRIGPASRIATSIVVGLLISVGLFVGFLVGAAMSDQPAVPGSLGWVLLKSITTGIVPIVVIVALFFHFRGGSLLLTKTGVMFSNRRNSVFCPWSLFDVDSIPATLNASEVVISVNFSAIEQVQLLRHGQEIENGRDVRTKYFRFRRDSGRRPATSHRPPEIVLGDNYSGRIEEIASLLVAIGTKISAKQRKSDEHASVRR